MARGLPEFEVSQHWLPHVANRDQTNVPFVRKLSSSSTPDDGQDADSKGLIGNYTLHRHPFRTTMLVIVPPLILAYFIVIWKVIFTAEMDVLKYGHRNATWVYYSWFIVGVFGLNVSRYGLAGVEAAMLQDPFWKVDNALSLMMHSEKGWSGPSGWFRIFKRLVRRRGSAAQRLWYLLALLSLIVSVALPLSGLSLELYDGYVYSPQHPSVIGRVHDTFSQREIANIRERGLSFWRTANPITAPGLGVIYTPSWVERKKYTSFSELPNSLPLDEDIPEIFLTVQSTVPLSGPSWGLKLSYNCSVVDSMSKFTILPKKSASKEGGLFGSETETYSLNTPLNDTIRLFNNTAYAITRAGYDNLWAYAEVGYSDTTAALMIGADDGQNEWSDSEKPRVLEYMLWQMKYKDSYKSDFKFDPELKPTIPEAGHPYIRAKNGTFLLNDAFFDVQKNDYANKNIKDAFQPSGREVELVAEPIGVRCLSMAATGTANVDARTSAFDSFEKINPKFNQAENDSPIPRFGKTAAELLAGHYYELFTSSNSPSPVSYSNSILYLNFLRPQVLKQAMMRAFATEALQLIYDGLGSFENSFEGTNLTSSKSGKILGPGSVPPLVAAVLFGIWAFGCVVLGCMYGFRPRWSEQLDGFTMFSYGVHLSNDIPDRSMLHSGKPFEECDGLCEFPGITSDKWPGPIRVSRA